LSGETMTVNERDYDSIRNRAIHYEEAVRQALRIIEEYSSNERVSADSLLASVSRELKRGVRRVEKSLSYDK
jgi:hypothetical protein